MVSHFLRTLLAAVLAFVCSLFGGCVLTGLTAGITIAPPGGYIQVGSFNDHPTTSQPAPVKVIPLEVFPSAPPPMLDIPVPTGDGVSAAA